MDVSDVCIEPRWFLPNGECEKCEKGQRECNQQTLKYHQKTTHRFKPCVFFIISAFMRLHYSYFAPFSQHASEWLLLHHLILSPAKIEWHLFRELFVVASRKNIRSRKLFSHFHRHPHRESYNNGNGKQRRDKSE